MSDTGGVNLAVRHTRSLASSDPPAAAVHSGEHVQLIRLLLDSHYNLPQGSEQANMLPFAQEQTGFTWMLWSQLEKNCLQYKYCPQLKGKV